MSLELPTGRLRFECRPYKYMVDEDERTGHRYVLQQEWASENGPRWVDVPMVEKDTPS